MVMGAPVATREWANMGALANWLAAKGAVLVPYSRLNNPGLADTDTITYRMRVDTRATALQRVWLIEAHASVDAGIPPFQLRVNGGATRSGASGLNVIVEDVSSPGSGLTELTLQLIAGESGALSPRGLTVYEQDRPELDAAGGEGVDTASLRSGQPIASGIAGASVGGITAMSIDARRAGLAHLLYGDAGNPSKSGTGYTTLTPLPLPLLGQVVREGATTATVRVTAYARMSAAGTGHIRLTRTKGGATTVINVSGTTLGWTTPVDVTIDADDMSTSDGLRGAAFDGLSVAIEGAVGSTIEVQSISFLAPAFA
ncbi:hypothetical protein DB32_006045 [Sandaracinus amylolyticus]|uniref:Uncharacterized protein n=2 Tax=Sandaracinus amylolyticus TaxID=927083 RepID=A0A0F6W709_9BACT|nr:hypothetical protein DB32_006045 [Sandaracinus amylolyticus]